MPTPTSSLIYESLVKLLDLTVLVHSGDNDYHLTHQYLCSVSAHVFTAILLFKDVINSKKYFRDKLSILKKNYLEDI